MSSSDTTSGPALAAIERIQAAALDGRTENVRYRQEQLQNIHAALREQAGDVCGAISKDAAHFSEVEVEAEFYLAMDAVRHFYEGLDFDAELAAEYSVARGEDNLTRRVGVGTVAIRPAFHTRLYSIICPLAAAVAAGNCVVLELGEGTHLQVDSTLRLLLPKALDPETSTIIDKPVTADNGVTLVSGTFVLVDQTESSNPANATPLTKLVSSGGYARCIAVVDRTADIALAARAITAARFSFGGASPYAPDLVLVNEFVKKDFFQACSSHATSFFAGGSRASVGGGGGSSDDEAATRDALRVAEEKGQVSSFGSSEFKLVDVLDRDTLILNMKIHGRYLPVVACSGLVDAAFAYHDQRQQPAPLLAGYFFADPRSAKYLAQHMPCREAFINQIPAYLLVGPAAPLATSLSSPSPSPQLGCSSSSSRHRYSTDMFSVARPQYAEPVPEPLRVVDRAILSSSPEPSSSPTLESAAAIRALAVRPLRSTRAQPVEPRDFFLSGAVIGGGITLGVILPAVGYATWIVGKTAVSFLARHRR